MQEVLKKQFPQGVQILPLLREEDNAPNQIINRLMFILFLFLSNFFVSVIKY